MEAVIKMTVTNSYPFPLDWIGLYKASNFYEVGWNKYFQYWGLSFDWMFLCGSQDCNVATEATTLEFAITDELEDGEYKVYLFYRDGFGVTAESDVFVIQREAGYCAATNAPTEAPVVCEDSTSRLTLKPRRTKKNKGGRFQKYCNWVRVRNRRLRRNRCNLRIVNSQDDGIKYVRDVCPETCDGVCTGAPTGAPTGATNSP